MAEMSSVRARDGSGRMLAAARALFLLLVFSLAFMRPSIQILGLAVVATDAIFLLLVTVWGLALVRGEARLAWHDGYWLIAAYLAALALSAMASSDPERSLYKLATQFYLLSLPVIGCSLIRCTEDLRRAVRWWLAGSAVVAAVAAASLALFLVAPGSPLLAPMINEFGTLAPGPYPRLRLTYEIANFLCNYLTVSLMILLVARKLGWIGTLHFRLLLAGTIIAAAFTISPGLGGVALALGLWIWLELRGSRHAFATAALAGGTAGALAFLAAATVTPVLHPTAPFLIHIPIVDAVVAPSVRLMTWMDGLANFASAPVLGRGLGVDAVAVSFEIPTGEMRFLTDAHNGFLNIAAQSGLVGLAAFVALLLYILRRSLPLRLSTGNAARLGFGLALLNGLAYQGLTGSFEDARYLWVLMGLFFAADRIERRQGAAAVSPSPSPGAAPVRS